YSSKHASTWHNAPVSLGTHSKAAGKMEQTGGFALMPRTMRRKRHRWGCRTGWCEREDRSDRAIITPAPHRTLILVKVPCSIVERRIFNRNTAPRGFAPVSLERLHLCCKGSCEFVESSLRTVLLRNPHHG